MKYFNFFSKTPNLKNDLISFFRIRNESNLFIPQVSYEEIIDYFVVNQTKPENAKSIKGAVLKEKNSKGFLIYQFYLDKDDNILSGRQINTLNIDQELMEAFSDKDLLIVQ